MLERFICDGEVEARVAGQGEGYILRCLIVREEKVNMFFQFIDSSG